MNLKFSIPLLAASVIAVASTSMAQSTPNGSVLEHKGSAGELIVSRDGVIYWLSSGDNLFDSDILRSQKADSATITYNGCTYTLPEQTDVALDDEFCAMAVVDEPSMALIASEGGSGAGFASIVSQANAPLIVGGVVLSAGGIATATGGDGGGTGSTASEEAGAAQSSAGSVG